VITSLYAAAGTAILIWLSARVIVIRGRERIGIGDGGCRALQLAMGAQSNAVEYLPLGLVLLFGLEFNQAPGAVVHGLGLALIVGRVVHAVGFLGERLTLRVLGMHVTFAALAVSATGNLAWWVGAQVL